MLWGLSVTSVRLGLPTSHPLTRRAALLVCVTHWGQGTPCVTLLWVPVGARMEWLGQPVVNVKQVSLISPLLVASLVCARLLGPPRMCVMLPLGSALAGVQ